MIHRMHTYRAEAPDGIYHVEVNEHDVTDYRVTVYTETGGVLLAGPVTTDGLDKVRALVNRITRGGALTIAALQQVSIEEAWEHQEVGA